MSEWWTYSLSDFQMYSADTWLNLLASYNDWMNPAQALPATFGLWLLWALWRGSPRAVQGGLAGLGVCWLWIAGAFFWERTQEIDIAAPWFAGLFVLQGLLLIAYSARFDAAAFRFDPTDRMFAAGAAEIGVIWWSVLMVMGTGSGWRSIALFGVTPDATALATLGALLVLRGARWLVVLPLAWCLVSGALQWNLGFQVAAVLPVLAVVAVGLSFRPAQP